MNSSLVICRFPSRIKYYKLPQTIFYCIQEQSEIILFSNAQCERRKLISVKYRIQTSYEEDTMATILFLTFVQ